MRAARLTSKGLYNSSNSLPPRDIINVWALGKTIRFGTKVHPLSCEVPPVKGRKLKFFRRESTARYSVLSCFILLRNICRNSERGIVIGEISIFSEGSILTFVPEGRSLCEIPTLLRLLVGI